MILFYILFPAPAATSGGGFLLALTFPKLTFAGSILLALTLPSGSILLLAVGFETLDFNLCELKS